MKNIHIGNQTQVVVPLGNLQINTKTLGLVTIVELSQLGVFNS